MQIEPVTSSPVPFPPVAVSPADRQALRDRLVEMDGVIDAEQATLGEAVALHASPSDIREIEDRLERALAEKRRCCLALDSVEAMLADAEIRQQKAERQAALEAAEADLEKGRALAGKVDAELARLKVTLDAFAAHGEKMAKHQGVLKVDYFRYLVGFHEVREHILQDSLQLRHVMRDAASNDCSHAARPIVSTYPRIEDIVK
jgi:hypothetical protein